MTWSLKLSGGDLIKGSGSSLATVSGSDKVQQDLRNWILSELGSDPFNPNFGSTIDHEPDTFVVDDQGESIYVSDDKLTLIVNEVDIIIERYQVRQLARMEQESVAYNGRHTLGMGEIITDYEIEYEQLLDTLYIEVKLVLLNNEERAIELAINDRDQ